MLLLLLFFIFIFILFIYLFFFFFFFFFFLNTKQFFLNIIHIGRTFGYAWRYQDIVRRHSLPTAENSHNYMVSFITKTRLFKYIENVTTTNWKFSDKNSDIFSYFCSKYRLRVLVTTDSARRFKRVPTIYVLSRNKKNNVHPCKPQFYYKKLGLREKNYIGLFSWCQTYALSHSSQAST